MIGLYSTLGELDVRNRVTCPAGQHSVCEPANYVEVNPPMICRCVYTTVPASERGGWDWGGSTGNVTGQIATGTEDFPAWLVAAFPQLAPGYALNSTNPLDPFGAGSLYSKLFGGGSAGGGGMGVGPWLVIGALVLVGGVVTYKLLSQ